MTVKDLIKGEAYYVKSSKTNNKYIFVFDKLNNETVRSSLYKCLNSKAGYRGIANLVDFCHIKDLRIATPEEKEILGIKPNKLKINKQLKLSFKL